MAKLTLISMVQKILVSMDSDDVNSLYDTEESIQIVDIIEDTYNFLMSEKNWPHLERTCQLISTSDSTTPTHLIVPSDVVEIGTLKYEVTESLDTDRKFSDLKYHTPQAFIDKMLNRASGDDNVDEVLLEDNTPIFIFNDRKPTFWTSFDDNIVVMDAYDSSEETTINGSKTIVLCTVLPSFTKEDTFIADLPDKMFPLFLAESRRACHLYLKQQDSAVDAKRALVSRNKQKSDDRITHGRPKGAKFGRRRVGPIIPLRIE